jgi:Uma2 family endonuclease
MSVTVEQLRKVWTEAEVQALPDDGYIHEVVNGELVMRPKNNLQHEDIGAELLMALGAYANARQLGKVLGSSFGCWMANRNCRAPDISFISKARLLSFGFTPSTRKFLPGAPDPAVEILSPSNRRSEIDERLKDFFGSGTQICWIINPDEECVEIRHSVTDRKLLGPGAMLDGEHLLPGFQFPIAGPLQRLGLGLSGESAKAAGGWRQSPVQTHTPELTLLARSRATYKSSGTVVK